MRYLALGGTIVLACGAIANATYTPAQIRAAYGFNGISFNGTSATGAGETIAIVDAYYNPTIKTDLSTFDATYGLINPPSFAIENESGGSALPKVTNSTWSLESDLDVEWAHAIAPKANIVLVEATNSQFSNLEAGAAEAASIAGVCAVSMSWGGLEYTGEISKDFNFTTPANHQGVAFVACTGDSGSPWWPAFAPSVLAVGGTALNLQSSGAYISETAWNDSGGSGGGGISTQEIEPDYQRTVQGSGYRSEPDVSYDAAKSTPMAAIVGGQSDYVDGTSCGAPQWAGLIALADQGRALAGLGSLNSSDLTGGLMPMLYDLYDTPYYDDAFNDVMSGTTGTGQAASVGYDTATGLGTPKAGFLVPYLADEIAIPETPSAWAALPVLVIFIIGRRASRVAPV